LRRAIAVYGRKRRRPKKTRYGCDPKLAPEAEAIILAELGRLADRVVGDVFESFSKHPKDLQQREQLEKSRLQDAKPGKE
jgi:hypothetical protein